MINIDRLTVNFHDQIVGTITLTPDNRLCAFEYAASWLVAGFSISPLELPLKPGLFLAKPQPFAGNFGIFEDSLPDGYGRYLLHKTLLKDGINDFDLTALERLSIVGQGGMGALTFLPETPIGAAAHEGIADFDLLQEKALAVLSEKTDEDSELLLYNSGNSGGCRPKAVFSDADGHWLVKFRHTYDPQDMGIQEYHYNEVARRCGIDVPDFRLLDGKYFATRRFDIDQHGDRLHTATAGGLLCVSLSSPVLDYSNLLALTGFITQNPKDVEELFRRMVFNYLTDNKDDHCKNFSYLVRKDDAGQWRWSLAPAYDLTLCTTGYNGEHATSVNGNGHPAISDIVKVGTDIRISNRRCLEIFDEVYSHCGDLLLYDIKH